VEVELADVHAPMFWGDDPETAFGFVTGLGNVQAVLSGLDADGRASVEQRLRDLMAAHLTAAGVLFDSRAWVVTARRR
jgi:hypothetical protein